jgi:hypothetical protein
MASNLNALRWDGTPGHYEVYYVALTDGRTGLGIWIRYTMLAPAARLQDPGTCSLWLVTMDPRAPSRAVAGRKTSYPIERMRARQGPFELAIGDAVLSDDGVRGAFEDVSWDLSWTPTPRAYEPVKPLLHALGVAQTAYVLPHADLSIAGELELGGVRVELSGARGAQAHLWGSKHAHSWAWLHCSDLRTLEGERVEDTFVEGVSARVLRFGREFGPSTPVVGRVSGEEFVSTSPLRILGNRSVYALTTWRFESIAGRRKLVGEVTAAREQLAGVTYVDPDGQLAYCYNSETATLRLDVYRRSRQVGGWEHEQKLVGPGTAHFEYAQRTPVPELELVVR